MKATTKQLIDELNMRIFERADCMDGDEWDALDRLKENLISNKMAAPLPQDAVEVAATELREFVRDNGALIAEALLDSDDYQNGAKDIINALRAAGMLNRGNP